MGLHYFAKGLVMLVVVVLMACEGNAELRQKRSPHSQKITKKDEKKGGGKDNGRKDSRGRWDAMAQNGGAVCTNDQWKTALLNEMMDYSYWRCSARLAADGTTQNCVITGSVVVSTVPPQTIITGCGWTMPLFCDDSVNDIVTALMAPPPNIIPAPVVPTGYTLVAGVGYYKVHTELLAWPAAKSACELEGGHLAVPSTSADYVALLTLLNAAIPTHNGAYIGLSDTAKEGSFVTVTGQPSCTLGQVLFSAGEPNNGGSSGTTENCVQFGYLKVATLNDVSCTTALPFICEVTLPSRLTICRK